MAPREADRTAPAGPRPASRRAIPTARGAPGPAISVSGDEPMEPVWENGVIGRNLSTGRAVARSAVPRSGGRRGSGQVGLRAYDGRMVTRKTSPVAVVTEGAAQAALRRGPATALSPEEERVLRMRLGASPPRTAPLARSVEDLSDVEIELLSYEIEAFMKARAAGVLPARAAAPEVRPVAVPGDSRVKEKIVRALRRKG